MTKDYKFFKSLSKEEEEEFRAWARDNYILGDTVPSTWHPVVVDECMSIIKNTMEPKSVDSKE
jgi:hypothetical protein